MLFSAAAFNTTTSSIKETTTICCLSLYTKISPSKFIAKKTTTTRVAPVESSVSDDGDDVSSSRGVLENAAKNDVELRNVLGDTIGDPDQMRLKVEDRIRKKGRDFHKSKTGSVVSFKLQSCCSNIWFKLYGPPSDRDVDLIGTVIQSWYLMGRLGAYNSSNLQWPFNHAVGIYNQWKYNPLYDADNA
ncbi:hypothetical protein Tco_0714102 [Tanacetum coccineum]